MARIFALVLGATPFVFLSGCSQVPRIDVVPVVENQRVVFDIPHSGVNGILGFEVEDESGKPLWVVKTSYEKGRKFIYGVLPTGGNMEAQQEFPPANRLPAEVRGKTVTVLVTYQYDSHMAPCSGTYRKTVRVPERSHAEQSPAPDRPRE
jgi:hypothetical protein